jgi:hypothetical protein
MQSGFMFEKLKNKSVFSLLSQGGQVAYSILKTWI